MKGIEGLSEIVSRYDALVVDAWGVLHDGVNPFSHAKEAMQGLMAEKKKVIIATNAPSRKKKVEEDLQRRGISRDLYSDIASSGELAFLELQQNQTLPKKCYYSGQRKHFSLLDGLDLEIVPKMERGIFWLNTGPYDPADQIISYQTLADTALRYEVPMVCVNPDQFTLFQGNPRICAGRIAKLYEDMGGKVTYFGKPYLSMYQFIRSLAALSSTFVAIGDSVDTDIKGGIEGKMDTILVYTGVTSFGTPLSIRPTYYMKQLKW
ncbi:MAG: TIGR01459 family HAD-type hydrolase [Parachlamydiales bacterium]|nr:TIGR01459 family HAD-type hydrolase [Parachlamydiales bacterium]